jgi:putative endonuclease
MEKHAFVYFMASRRNGTIYVGVTNCLAVRVWQHRNGLTQGFTKRYGVRMLVYYESFETIAAAIQREQNIKHWPRRWKLALIEKLNPQWRDLYEDINS